MAAGQPRENSLQSIGNLDLKPKGQARTVEDQ